MQQVGRGDVEQPQATVIALLAERGEAAPAQAPAIEDAAAIAGPAEPAPVVEPMPPRPAAQRMNTPRPRAAPADRIKVSPLAQRIADMKGVDLSGVTGSGPNGRIVRADLGLSPPSAPTEAIVARAPAAFAPPPAGVPVDPVKLSTMRKTIARRLTESKQSVPHFYLTARCNLDPLLALRSELNQTLGVRGIKLSVNDLLIKALALALTQVPDANVQFGGDLLHRFARADISMAVAIEGGLVTPVIRDAGALSLSALPRQARRSRTRRATAS